jgi:hypothetical protein
LCLRSMSRTATTSSPGPTTSRPVKRPLSLEMALTIHPALQAALGQADQSAKPIDEHDLAASLHKVLGELGHPLEPDEKRGAFAVVGPFDFTPRRHYGEPVWDMYWQPVSTWLDDQNVPHHIPDIAQADDEAIGHWGQAARSAQHPVIRARYGDFAWDVARFRTSAWKANPQGPAPSRPDATAARLAITAYFESVERRLAHDTFDAWGYLARAIELAATLRDSALGRRGKTLMLAYGASCEAEDPGYPFWLADDIAWERRDLFAFTTDEHAAIVAALERALAVRADPRDPRRFDPHIARDAADRLARWRREAGEEADAARASATAGRAMEDAAEQASGLTAIALLSDQVARYRSIGDEAAAARVEQTIRRRAAEAKSELKRIEVKYEIAPEQLEQWADRVAGDTFEEGLQRVVAANIVRRGTSETRARELSASSPLHEHLHLSIMRDDGFTSAVIGSMGEDPEGRAIQQAANEIGMTAPFLHVSLHRFREKHSVDLDRLMAWLSESPFFTPSRLALVREGLAAWFAEDAVKAIHVLVPQIEAALRDVLNALGGAVTRPDRYTGGSQTIGLGEVLSHERIRSLFPEDVRFYFRVLYQDGRGINLRNELAHGLASRALFDRGIANWVVHSLVLVGLIRVRRKAGGA